MKYTSFVSALSSTLCCALLGCASADGDGADVPAFQAPSANGAGAPPSTVDAPVAPAPGTSPAAPPPAASPAPAAPSGEAPAPAAGLDTSGAAPAATPSSSPPPAGPAPAPPAPAPAAAASAGCGLAQGVPADPGVPNTLVTFPDGYDGSTPQPLVFAFHGANRTNEEMRNDDSRTAGGALESRFVMAYMKSAGGAWDLGTDHPRFSAALEQMQAELCIDTAHVFAFGHSSGAQFIVQMLGNPSTRERRFAGVVEVASSRFNNPAWEPLPTLVIHGVNDNQRPGDNDGASDIVQYTESNRCAGGTQPLNVPGCTSIANQAAVNSGCVQYVDCAAPTLFCQHDDPNYFQNGTPTNHGWPCFANGEILRFFESLL